MSQNHNIYSPRVRKRKAYSTALIVFFSYYFLYLKSKIFGSSYWDKRINSYHLRNADRIKKRVQELQGLFIKFGQLISNLSNALPVQLREPLEELQDHIKAKPYEEVRQTIIDELGKDPKELFEDFNEKPLAAASIGQVHRARINGKDIIVKVQHSNIEAIAKADLEILRNLVKIHAFFMDMHGLDHTYEQVRQMIREELDYRQEAQSMQLIAKNLTSVPELKVRIPDVLTDYNTSKILVASFEEGTSLAHLEQMKKWGLDVEEIAQRLTELFCKMVLVDGFYHADPHPGNILVNPSGEIILLDFGATAHLAQATKKAIPMLVEAVIRNDTEATVTALKQLGFIGSDEAAQQFVEELIEQFKQFLQEEVELDGLNFQNIKLNSGFSSVAAFIQKIDLRDVSNTIRIPKDYILLNRTIVLLIGNIYHLAPELNALDVVRPYMRKHVLSKDGGFTQMIIDAFKNQITTVIALPHELSRYLKKANKGQLQYEVKGLEQGLGQLYRLGNRFLFAFVIAFCVWLNIAYPHYFTGISEYISYSIIGLSSLFFIKTFFSKS